MARFKLRPTAHLDPKTRSLFEGIELFLNTQVGDSESLVGGLAGQRKLLMQGAGALLGSSPVNVRAFGGTGLIAFAANTTNPIHLIRLVPGDWTVSGKTPQLRVRGNCMVNATAPGASADFALGLYPVSAVAGAAGGVTYTKGTVVPGSTFTFNSGTALSASTRYEGESADFDVPSSGWYALAVDSTGATTAANNHLHFSAQLFIHYV